MVVYFANVASAATTFLGSVCLMTRPRYLLVQNHISSGVHFSK